MSDLKHRTPEELLDVIVRCERYESELRSKIRALDAQAGRLRHNLNNSTMRHKWARKYLEQKTSIPKHIIECVEDLLEQGVV